MFSTPRAGARVFVELDEFKSFAAVGTTQDPSRFFRNSFSQRWWPNLQKHMDVPSEHLLHGTMGTRGLTRKTNSLVHKNAVSLSTLFLLTFHWCRHLFNSEARLLTSGLFSSLMKLLPKGCRISVRLNPREQDPRVAEVLVVAGMVQPCSALQVILPQSPWLKTTWPCGMSSY